MKKYIPIVFGLILMLGSCEKNPSDGENKSLVLQQKVDLKVGECVSDNTGLNVCLDSISSDSRCPSDVQCIWEGNASVEISFTVDGTKHQLTLNTNNSDNFPSDTTIKQYRISVNELLPYPVSTLTIGQEDYLVSLVVEELED